MRAGLSRRIFLSTTYRAVLNTILIHQDIDNQLRTAAEAFLENDDGCVVDSGKREVRLSQIFKWYKADFGGTDEKVVDHQETQNQCFLRKCEIRSLNIHVV